MRRKILSLSVLLFTLVAVFFVEPQQVVAQNGGGGGGRFTTVESTTKQYVWNLVSNKTGQAICEVIIDHDGQPTQYDAITACAQEIFAQPPVPAPGEPIPTQAPFDINEFFRTVRWEFVGSREVTRLIKVPLPDMVVYVTAPQGPLLQPYVILTAYEPVSEYKIVRIQGQVGSIGFVCDGSRCEVPVMQDTRVIFWAYSSLGDQSERVQADVRVVRRDEGFFVSITGVSRFAVYEDICAQYWGVSDLNLPDWASFPPTPEELHTQRTLHFLTSKLIMTGLVDARDCPGNGFLIGGAPNACGIEAAQQTMITWQNQFDPTIWAAGRDVGVPPILLKSLIELELQFWPANARFYIQEFGLGQMNQLGADVALRWDQNLYLRVCTDLLLDCTKPYASLPSYTQAMVRGALMRIISADCATCPNGLNLASAEQSISIIGQTMRANCQQTGYIVDQLGASANYEDLWRFTMASYHSGYSCLRDAIAEAKHNNEPTDWEHVSPYLCDGAQSYVDDLWRGLYSFNQFVVPPVQPAAPTLIPTFLPTPTQAPTISTLSTAQIRVVLYIDNNNNNIPDVGELINGVAAQIVYESGKTETKTVTDGQVVFDATGVPIGSAFTINIPSLYRTYTSTVPAQGEALVTIRLTPPELPPLLP